MYFLSNFHVHVFLTLYMYVTKKHSSSEVSGTKEFDLSYTNLYLIRFISFAILDKMNETEFALSVNSLVISMFVIRVHVIVFYQNSLCLFSPQVLVARQHHPLSSSKFYTLFVVRAIRLGWGGGNDQYFFPVHFVYFPRWYTLNYKYDSFTGLQQSNPRTSNVIIPMHLLIFLIIVCAYCSSLDHNPLNIYHC